MPSQYFFAYFVFFSALVVTIRSDLETLLISRFMTLFLIPFALLFSLFDLLPIGIAESIMGTGLGYFFLFAVAHIFQRLTGKSGIGQGDLDLLACIGSFTGIVGCWISLLIGSVIGSVAGLTYLMMFKQKLDVKIPFGPFLATGAIIFVLYQPYIYLIVTQTARI